MVERRRALDRAEAGLVASAAGHAPTPAQLAAATGLSVDAVVTAQSAGLAPVSLDEPVLPDGSSLASVVADPEAADPELRALEHEQSELLLAALEHLPERQRRVVSRQWGIGVTPRSNAQLAAELELSRRRTQTIGQDALHELRAALEPSARAVEHSARNE